MKQYIYRGDKLTDPALKGHICTAVVTSDEKCIRGRNGNMLVRFETGVVAVVVGRRLTTIKPVIDLTRTESLFISVEEELARRWKYHNVPPVFAQRPALHLRLMVEVWWNLYHESTCARNQQDRTIWTRDPDHVKHAAQAELETQELISSLAIITKLLYVDAILMYRPLSLKEESGIGLLTLLTAYYSSP